MGDGRKGDSVIMMSTSYSMQQLYSTRRVEEINSRVIIMDSLLVQDTVSNM